MQRPDSLELTTEFISIDVVGQVHICPVVEPEDDLRVAEEEPDELEHRQLVEVYVCQVLDDLLRDHSCLEVFHSDLLGLNVRFLMSGMLVWRDLSTKTVREQTSCKKFHCGRP